MGLPSTSGIYAIHSAVNGRTYIGHSVNILKRWGQHRTDLRNGKHPNPHLQNAWNKYSESAFEFIILEECAVELLLEREQYYMNQTVDHYNLCPVAGSRLGTTHTPESKAKMRVSQRGNTNAAGHVVSDGSRVKMGTANVGNKRWLGKKHSEESKAKMSTSKIGNTHRTGHKHSPETRAKISASMKAQMARKNAAVTSDDEGTNDVVATQ